MKALAMSCTPSTAGRLGCGPTRKSSSSSAGCAATTKQPTKSSAPAFTAWMCIAFWTRCYESWGTWNPRDHHMAETLERLVQFHSPQAKAIVWEHNTHIGDARHTDMADDGTVNVGQLVREAHTADDVVLIGFGSHRGSVIAARGWDEP